jgi:hypothetical protein
MWYYLTEKFELLFFALVIMNPESGWVLILRNCAHLDGRFSMKRAKAELYYFIRFLVVLAVAPLTYLAIVWVALIIFGGHTINIAQDPANAQVFMIKDGRWWENVDWAVVQQEFDKVHDNESWEEENPISPDTALVREKRDEYNRPVLFVGGAVLLGMGLLIFVTLMSLSVFKRYHAELIRRKETYYDIDLHTIPRYRIL